MIKDTIVITISIIWTSILYRGIHIIRIIINI